MRVPKGADSMKNINNRRRSSNMKKVKYVMALAVTMMGVSVSAELIVSESFSTGNGSDYVSGVKLDQEPNKSNLTGTFGFSASAANTWFNGTTSIQPKDGAGLTHSLVQGTSAGGGLKMSTVNQSGGARKSMRKLAATPSGSSFYMSGLVTMNGFLSNLDNGERIAMGLGTNPTNIVFSCETGLFLGLTKDENGDVYLAAFAGGNTYKLGSALTAAQADETQMIVLKLDFNTSGVLDTLTAWTARQTAKELTQVLSISDLDTGSTRNLMRFLVQNQNGMDTSSGTVYLDEFRFGTTLQDVTNIP